jgi:hypothetical protein
VALKKEKIDFLLRQSKFAVSRARILAILTELSCESMDSSELFDVALTSVWVRVRVRA